MPVSFEHNCIFVHIPKNAGTLICSWLETLDPIRFNIDRSPMTASQMIAVDIGFKKKFSFAISRNPFTRIMSVWRYSIDQKIKNYDHLSTKEQSLLSKHAGDFNAWFWDVAVYMDHDRSFMILPQWYWIYEEDKLLVNEVWRIEDMTNICGELNARLGTNFTNNIMINQSYGSKDYQRLASLETKQVLLKLYASDCDKFNYEW